MSGWWKHVVHITALGFAAGICLSQWSAGHLGFGRTALGFVACLCCLRLLSAGRSSACELMWIAVFLIGAALGSVSSQMNRYRYDSAVAWLHSIDAYGHDAVKIHGTVAAQPRHYGNTVDLVALLNLITVPGQGNAGTAFIPPGRTRLRLRAETDDGFQTIRYGARITCNGRLSRPDPPLNPNAFNLAHHFRERRLHGELRVRDGTPELTAQPRGGNGFSTFALGMRERLQTAYHSLLSPRIAAFAAGATLGARDALADTDLDNTDIQEAFRHAGISHVLAVSGLHVGILAGTLYLLGKRLHLNARLLALGTATVLGFFAVMTGGSPATVRAVTMASFVLLINGFTDWKLLDAAWIGLSLSALLILFANPLLLFSPSFQLSFAAVISLLALTPPLVRGLRALSIRQSIIAVLWATAVCCVAWTRMDLLASLQGISVSALTLLLGLRFARTAGATPAAPGAYGGAALPGAPETDANHRRAMRPFARLPRWVTAFLAAQFAIQIGTLVPLSAWYFGRFSVAGCFVNFAAIPLVGLFVQGALLTGVLALIPYVGSILAWLPALATEWLGRGFLGLAWLGMKGFPYPAVSKPTVGEIFMYYAFLGLCFALFPRLMSRPRQDAGRIPNPALQSACGNSDSAVTAAGMPPPHSGSGQTQSPGRLVPACLVLLLLGTVVHLSDARPSGDFATVLHLNATPWRPAYPVVCGVRDGQTFLVNCGDAYSAERIVFRYLCWIRRPRVDLAVLPSKSARAGEQGLQRLARMVRVNRCIAANPEDVDQFCPALPLRPEAQTTGDGRLPDWLRLYPAVKGTGCLTVLECNGRRIGVLTDANGTVAFDNPPRCDILVVPWKKARPASSGRAIKRLENAVTGAIQTTRPRHLVVVDGAAGAFAERHARRLFGPIAPGCSIVCTSTVGAIRLAPEGLP